MKKPKIVLTKKELLQIKGGDTINSNGVPNCMCAYNDTCVIENDNDVEGCKCVCTLPK